MITEFSFSQKRIDLTDPGTLQTSLQFLRSSARQTLPDQPPKKKRLLTLSPVVAAAWFRTRLQKTIWLMPPSRAYWQTGVNPRLVRQTAHTPFMQPVTMRLPSVENVMLVIGDLWTALSSLVRRSSSFQRSSWPSVYPIARAQIDGCHSKVQIGTLLRWMSKLGITSPSSEIKITLGRLVATASTQPKSLLLHAWTRACSPSTIMTWLSKNIVIA